MISEFDVNLPDGGVVHGYDTGPADSRLTVVWHHGTPNIGTPPEPLFEESQQLGIRWVSYDRPGYGGSSPRPGRDVASAAADVSAVVDALGIGRFAVLGHSGGGPHALACAALLGDRVLGAVSGAGLAPLSAEGLDWFAGMAAGSEAGLRAAAAGRAAKAEYEAHAEFGADSFTAADYAALEGRWSWFNSVVSPAVADGPGPLIDDDLAYVGAWGFDPAAVSVPTQFLHGEHDRMVPSAHSRWLAGRVPHARLQLVPAAGHISVLDSAGEALRFLAEFRS
ncbi:MAG: alpha/beta fold hydrolase [Stackebrandtia sp.]